MLKIQNVNAGVLGNSNTLQNGLRNVPSVKLFKVPRTPINVYDFSTFIQSPDCRPLNSFSWLISIQILLKGQWFKGTLWRPFSTTSRTIHLLNTPKRLVSIPWQRPVPLNGQQDPVYWANQQYPGPYEQPAIVRNPKIWEKMYLVTRWKTVWYTSVACR